MKLSELRAAIRKMKGNPSITVELTPGVPMTLVLQKTPTLEALGQAYNGVSGDIGLSMGEDGVIYGPLTPAPDDDPDLDDDEDDML
jgi:hypothetical protein